MMTSVLRFKYLFTVIFLVIGVGLWLVYPRYHEFNGQIYGTYYKIVVFSPKISVNDDDLHQQIRDELDRLDHVFSTYKESSDISKFNSATGLDPAKVNVELYNMVVHAKQLYQKMGGAWDPTILRLSQHYGFQNTGKGNDASTGNHHKNRLKSESNLLKKSLGFDYIKVLPNQQLKKKRQNIQLDFSSMAKGYAVDKITELILTHWVYGTYVDIGGEIRTTGSKPQGKPWKIGIQSPNTSDQIAVVVVANNLAMATSGNYLNYVEKNGQKIGHILDPRSGLAIKHGMLSVSVVATSCAVADALATGLFVMGPDDAKIWLNQHVEYPAMLIYTDQSSIHMSYFNKFKDKVAHLVH